MTFSSHTLSRPTQRPTLRRASPLRLAATLFVAVLSSTAVLGGVLSLFDTDLRTATVARSAPATTGTPSTLREARAAVAVSKASGG